MRIYQGNRKNTPDGNRLIQLYQSTPAINSGNQIRQSDMAIRYGNQIWQSDMAIRPYLFVRLCLKWHPNYTCAYLPSQTTIVTRGSQSV